MKIWLTILPLTLLNMIFMPASGKTYYVSSAGSDHNSGLSIHTSWQTIQKVNAFMVNFHAGDSILLRRGDAFVGTLHITSSGSLKEHLVFSTFGKGSQPIVTGTIGVKGWGLFTDSIWKAHFDTQAKKIACRNVFKNGIPLPLGRWPNPNGKDGGFLAISASSDKNDITDSLLSDASRWLDGEVVIRYNHWTLTPSQIINTAPYQLQFLNKGTYKPIKGWGYYIQNNLATLDSEGEWFYDQNNHDLYIYSEKDPSMFNIEVSVMENLIVFANGSAHVTIEDLDLKGGFSDAITGKGSAANRLDDITIDHCKILYPGKSAIDLSLIKNSNLTNNKIYGCHESGINVTDIRQSSIVSNTIIATSLTPGLAGRQGASIKLNTRNNDSVTIQYNYCDSTGYSHVLFGGSHLLIKNNLLKNYCMLTDDGAAIYCFKNTLPGNVIVGNIIIDGHSSPNGVPMKNRIDAPVAGIYLDDSTRYVQVISNTIARTGIGIMLNNTSSDTVKYNKIFGAESALRYNRWKLKDEWAAMRDLVVKQNQMFSTCHTDTLIRCWDRNGQEIKSYGAGIDSNYLVFPYKQTNYIAIKENDTSPKVYISYNLNDWQQRYGHDLHSSFHSYQEVLPHLKSPLTFFEYNADKKPRRIVLPPGIYVDPKGTKAEKSVVIQPYDSLILYQVNSH